MENRKANKIKTVPDHFTSVTPWIISGSTSEMIDFLTGAFQAQETAGARVTDKAGVVIHTEINIGGAMINLFDTREGWGPTPTFINLYVSDVEKTRAKALELGATSVTDVTALYFGEKVCRILDPFGNLWWLTERVEEIAPEEIKRRASTPEAIRGITYIQKSLDEAMKAQKAFFDQTAQSGRRGRQ